MACIWFPQLDLTTFFLTQQVHKEALVDLGVELWESTSCAGVNSRVNTRGLENTNTIMIF
jgi:hypothetical protein